MLMALIIQKFAYFATFCVKCQLSSEVKARTSTSAMSLKIIVCDNLVFYFVNKLKLWLFEYHLCQINDSKMTIYSSNLTVARHKMTKSNCKSAVIWLLVWKIQQKKTNFSLTFVNYYGMLCNTKTWIMGLSIYCEFMKGYFSFKCFIG